MIIRRWTLPCRHAVLECFDCVSVMARQLRIASSGGATVGFEGIGTKRRNSRFRECPAYVEGVKANGVG